MQEMLGSRETVGTEAMHFSGCLSVREKVLPLVWFTEIVPSIKVLTPQLNMPRKASSILWIVSIDSMAYRAKSP